jgi:4-diphosphocytidyl-2-C-methyl-D-erythritol kinase
MSTRVRSFSKINLGLTVGPSRPDGFHGLSTVYQTLALHDFVTVSARLAEHTQITLTADHPGVPTTARGTAERNTAWKIVDGALQRLGVCPCRAAWEPVQQTPSQLCWGWRKNSG